jgi:NADH-quinone oxidoreductase subunit J
MSGPLAVFLVLAALSIGSAIALVANRNPVRSALSLVVNLLSLAAIYVTLSAQFIAAVQVIVYAGAIMVLFLFVIMLLNLGDPGALRESGGLRTPVAVGLAVLFVVLLGAAGAISTGIAAGNGTVASAAANGTVEAIGLSLFDPKQPWVFPFELTSILLLIGIVGSVVLAKRRL